MVRLESEGTILDMFDDEPVTLNLNVQNLRDIGKIYAPISKSFTLPASNRNNQFFKHYYNVNVSGGFNAKTRTPAQLYVDSDQVITGYLQLLDCVIENENPKQYSVMVASSTPNLAKTLEGKVLSDLSLSGVTDATYNRTTLLASWSAASGVADIRYGLVGTKAMIDQQGILNAQGLSSQNKPLLTSDFYPYMRLTTIAKGIIEENGFRYSSTFLDSDIKANNTYLLLGRNGGLLSDIDIFNARAISVSGVTSISLEAKVPDQYGGPDEDRFKLLTFPTEEFDDSGLWNTTNSSFRPDATGTYKFEFSYTLSAANNVEIVAFDSADITGGCDPYTGSGCSIQPFGIQLSASNGATSITKTLSFGLTAATDYVFYARVQSGTATMTTRTFKSIEVPLTPVGQTLNYSNLLPYYSQASFLAQIAKIYNLVFVPDRYDDKLIHIEPYDDWLALGSTFDLTRYLDISKELIVKPTNELQNRSIKFLMGKGETAQDEYFEKQFSVPVGSLAVTDTGNEFATGELSVNTDFVCSLMTKDTTSLLQFPQLTDSSFDIVDFGLRLGYWSGTQTYDYDFQSTSGVVTSYVGELGFLPPYTAHDPSQSDFFLGFTPTVADGLEVPLNNFFTEYWESYISNIYDDDSRIVEGEFYLPSAALNKINLNDLMLLKNQYYLIQSINYNSLTKKAKIELLKAVNTSPVICDLVPTAFNFRGVVSFTDPSGATVTAATRSCCEFYGFTFNASDSKCYSKWRKPRTVVDGNTISMLPSFDYGNDPTNTEPQLPMYNPISRTYSFVTVKQAISQQFGDVKYNSTDAVIDCTTTSPSVTYTTRQVNFQKSGQIANLNAVIIATSITGGTGDLILDLSSVLPDDFIFYDDGAVPPQPVGFATILGASTYKVNVMRYSDKAIQFYNEGVALTSTALASNTNMYISITYLTEA